MQNINTEKGLTEYKAQRILEIDGFNDLPSDKKQNVFLMFFKVMSEPMLLLLIGGGIIYLFMGEMKDALMLLFFVFAIISITFYQERKTEKTLDALRDLSNPKVLVIRDGKQKKINSREIVRGDIFIIREGDRVPADAIIVSNENLYIDESLLTGESMPVRKINWDEKIKDQRPGGDDLPFIYSGSMVVSGHGLAKVNHIGLNTEIGKIGRSLEKIKDEDTLLRKETSKIVRFVAIISVILCILMVIVYTTIKGDLIGGFLSGLTLGMAILPEEFPLVLLIFLTLGAWRISKNNVLTRNPAAIETLGAATVLCTDKTGTLTLNKMELNWLYSQGSSYEFNNSTKISLPNKFESLLECGILASQKYPYDPIEKELEKMGNLYLKNNKITNDNLELIKEYPLSKELLALSHVWKNHNQEFIIASKGAPEAVLDLCHVDGIEREDIIEKVKEMSEKGLRILGVARAIYRNNELPVHQHEFKFTFVGFNWIYRSNTSNSPTCS